MVGLIILGILFFISIVSVVYGVDSRDASRDALRSTHRIGLL